MPAGWVQSGLVLFPLSSFFALFFSIFNFITSTGGRDGACTEVHLWQFEGQRATLRACLPPSEYRRGGTVGHWACQQTPLTTEPFQLYSIHVLKMR